MVAELEVFPARVRAHVSAAYLLLEDDPVEALRYAEAAKQLASRSAAVREAVGVVAYHAGDYALAAKELRTARRISGTDDVLPLIADCERALGHPEKALEIATGPAKLTRADKIEMLIVGSGARMDLGQPDAAVLMLQVRFLESPEVSEASARLKYAYAEALLAAGRVDESRQWFLRAAAADEEGATDAADRALLLDEGEG